MSRSTNHASTEKRYEGVLDFSWMTLAPLSHIGESDGNESSLVSLGIEGPDGSPTEVFVYQGNAVRGMLRDASAKYFQDHIEADGGTVRVSPEAFYMMWSGGVITDEFKIDLAKSRNLRKVIPHLSVFGSAIGTGTLPGRIDVGNLYPLYQETRHIVPEQAQDRIRGREWITATSDVTYSRVDDMKYPDRAAYALDPAEETLAIEGEKSGKKKKERAPQQMRYGYEVVNPGTWFWSELDLRGLTAIEMGCLVSALWEWSKHPKLGGKLAAGMGKVRMSATLNLYDDSEASEEDHEENFVTVQGRGRPLLGPIARECKLRYDDLLKDYQAYLQEQSGEIRALLGAGNPDGTA